MKLSQIVVDEVSLVDKAANKRKFLLFKRDSGSDAKAQLLKDADKVLTDLLAVIKAKDDGAPNETPNYAQQAKDLLNGKITELVSMYTDSERSALHKATTPPPPTPVKDANPPVEEFSAEEISAVKAIDAAVTSLQQELASLKG